MNRLMKEEKQMNSIRIRNILNSYDALYREINEYNTTYWSKFLIIIWSLLGALIVFVFYLLILGSFLFAIKITLSYYLIINCFMFVFILSISSSVNLEEKKSYKILSSFIVKYRSISKCGLTSIFINHMKVILALVKKIKKNF